MPVLDSDYQNFMDGIPDEMPQKYLALTEKESAYINKTESIVSLFNQKFIVIDEDGSKALSLPENYHDLLSAEMQRKHLSLKKAEMITDKAFKGKWYTIILAGDKEPETGLLSFYLVTDQTEGKGVYLDEESPYYSLFTEASASAEAYCLKERELLGLTEDYKFILSAEYFTMLKILNFKRIESSRGTVEGKLILKSSPMLILPVKIGRAAIKNAVDGVRMDRGRSVLTVGKYKISYTPNKAASLLTKNVNGQKLLDLIQGEAYLTGYKTTRLKIPMRKILELRGLKDMKELKKQITSAAALVDDMYYTGTFGSGDFDKIAVTQGDTSIIQGYLYVNVNEKFLDGLRNTPHTMFYPLEMQKLPSIGFSYGFARLFVEHKRRNAGQPNENRLAVSTLLEASPYPLFEDLPNSGHAAQKIIEPFLKCFDKIEEHRIFSYRLCKSGGEDLTNDEYEKALTDYVFFSSLIVEVNYFKENEPDYSHLIDLKAKANGAKQKGRPSKASAQKKPAATRIQPKQTKQPAKKKSGRVRLQVN